MTKRLTSSLYFVKLMSNCPLRIQLNVISQALCVAEDYEKSWLTSQVLSGRISTAYDYSLHILKDNEHEV